MVRFTRAVLAHRRLVVAAWVALTVAGMAGAGAATKALSDQYTVPGHEGYETNQRIARAFGTGGNAAPILAAPTLPAGASARSRQAVAAVGATRPAAAMPRRPAGGRAGGAAEWGPRRGSARRRAGTRRSATALRRGP